MRSYPHREEERQIEMAAYIVIDRLSVTDTASFGTYQPLTAAALMRYGGRYVLPLEAQIEPLEGNWLPNRIVVIEFADAEQARRWWESAEYAPARTLHHEATISNVILVDGTSC
jgi:uncharacterized protein (DUF1330 family)